MRSEHVSKKVGNGSPQAAPRAARRLGGLFMGMLFYASTSGQIAYALTPSEHRPSGEVSIGGFVYQAPGSAWKAKTDSPPEGDRTRHTYRRENSGILFEASWYPIPPGKRYFLGNARDLSSLLDYTANAWGGGTAEPAVVRGATCARYAHRWDQTISINGAPPGKTATFEDRGLICIDPTSPSKLLRLRITEHLVPDGSASPEFGDLADWFLNGVRMHAP